jgi:hypothetical protein
MDVKSWVLADFGRGEQTGWLQTLLDAMADEADRLVEHDDGGFMSRVSYLAPAPQPKDDNGKDKPASAVSKQN